MPPSMTEMPSPAMSAIKKYLEVAGSKVKIIYWNLKLYRLQQEFVWGHFNSNDNNETIGMLLFSNYIAYKRNNKTAKNKIKSALMEINPSLLTIDPHSFNRHMDYYATRFEDFLSNELKKISWSEILFVGFSANLYQWISSSILAAKIKELSPSTPIVIGGIGAKEAAIDILNNFTQFDIAIWGEGEYCISKLAEAIVGGISSEKVYSIPHLAFRTNSGVVASSKRLSNFIDLNNMIYFPQFRDFLEQKKACGLETTSYFPIEGARGCHWNRCHFCYLNTGYKHRVKSVENIILQLRRMIDTYHVYNYCFLDNDVISNDWDRFNKLLECLIELKDQYPNFEIILAEIITSGISENYIRKMSLAGFKNVQIGYESPSNNLLKKIEKKNTFASNLLFIKFADKYNININGMNVITGLLEERPEDIEESIINLRFMRFFLKKYPHNMSKLGIMHSSRYFSNVKDDGSFVISDVYNYLPQDYISKGSIHECYFIEKVKGFSQRSWLNFVKVEQYYKENYFSYKIFDYKGSILYKEYLNNEEINELEIKKDSIEFLILSQSNSSVFSLSELHSLINEDCMLDCEMYDYIENLKEEGLIYTNTDYSEIVSIIDINSRI